MNSFYATGDLGDIIASLPVVRQLGGGEYILGPHRGSSGPREPMTQQRAEFIIPLLKAQAYITESRYESTPVNVTLDLSLFRSACHYMCGESLTHWHGRHAGIPAAKLNISNWLNVTPNPETNGKIVVARSPRYHSKHFPWHRQMRKYAKNAVFVGLPHEHQDFVSKFGFIPYRPVKDALEMAQLIAGSEHFIGNQSFPMWIALGLGVSLLQETFAPALNSIIRRPNAKYL